jgi:hypothetical protein
MNTLLTPLECCRQELTEAGAQVAATLPPGRTRRLLALSRIGEIPAPVGDAIPAARPGWNLALRVCLERDDDEDSDASANHVRLDAWAERFLGDCDQLAQAYLALAQCELGHIQLQQRGPHTFIAWPVSRRLSPEQRERADFDWWSAHLAQHASPRLAPLLVERPHMRALLSQATSPLCSGAGPVVSDLAVERYYRELGRAHVARFDCQHSYPRDAAVGGVTFGQYAEILALLIGWLYREHDRRGTDGEPWPAPWNEQAVIAALAHALDVHPPVVGHALQHLILDRDNAAYHSALPGHAAPPLIRLYQGQVIPSAVGLLGEPLVFLARQLRRRHAQEYHNAARLREDVFRQDLYRLFGDNRFVLSPRGVELRRSGKPRTDVDALVFDRKMGALGVFELKAQDPFAGSVEERKQQRDNFFHANRQVSAILDWVQRNGPDDLLLRFDERTAKRFHVQKVYVFVLGRYTAHFSGGPEPERRAAWGSWPQVLRIVEDESLDSGRRDPLGILFARLRDAAPESTPANAGTQTITVRDFRLHMFPSFTAMRAEEDRPL